MKIQSCACYAGKREDGVIIYGDGVTPIKMANISDIYERYQTSDDVSTPIADIYLPYYVKTDQLVSISDINDGIVTLLTNEVTTNRVLVPALEALENDNKSVVNTTYPFNAYLDDLSGAVVMSGPEFMDFLALEYANGTYVRIPINSISQGSEIRLFKSDKSYLCHLRYLEF